MCAQRQQPRAKVTAKKNNNLTLRRNRIVKDIMGMMKQVQQMQSKMQDMQNELADMEIDGQSGGGLVTVTLNGKSEMRGIKIDPSLVIPEEVEILEDLIVAATQDAKTKAETLMQEKMQGLAGGLPIPPGLKLF